MAGSRTGAGKRLRRAKPPARSRPRRTTARTIEAKLADLAHEIRTPLTGILALSELLASSQLGERERGWANAIKSTAEHLAMLTALIVDAARADSKGLVLRRELVRPRRLVDALAASLAARARAKGLEVETDVAGDLPDAVIGDPLRLRAAVENLIDNAVKFTERGSVRLEVTARNAARDKTRLTFAVSDSGIGLTSAEIKQLFRPFAQANEDIARRFGGAGLGLAFVKRIAEAMGGDLTVASRPGGGSCFRLAVVLDRATSAAVTGAVGEGPPARSLAILCVEDNPYGRVVLNTILTELGHRPDFVATGAAAIDAVAHGRYDVVLMDVTLPDMDGAEATRRIRALEGAAGRVAIVGVSGRADPADEATGGAAGMDGYVVKPLGPSMLSQALGSLRIDRRS
jgi:two-component system, sensor histidine kinase